MPNAWSKKDERQYEHVKESEEEQGRSGSSSGIHRDHFIHARLAIAH